MLSMFKDKKGFAVLFKSREQAEAALAAIGSEAVETDPPRDGRYVKTVSTKDLHPQPRQSSGAPKCQRCTKHFHVAPGTARYEFACPRCEYATCRHCREVPRRRARAPAGCTWLCCACNRPTTLMRLLEDTRQGKQITMNIIEYCDPRAERIMKSFFRPAVLQMTGRGRDPSSVSRSRNSAQANALQRVRAEIEARQSAAKERHRAEKEIRFAELREHSPLQEHSPNVSNQITNAQQWANAGSGKHSTGDLSKDGDALVRTWRQGVVEYSPEHILASPINRIPQDLQHRPAMDLWMDDADLPVSVSLSSGCANNSTMTTQTTTTTTAVATPRTSGTAAFEREAQLADRRPCTLEPTASRTALGEVFSLSPPPKKQGYMSDGSSEVMSGRSESPAPRFPTFTQFLGDQAYAAQQHYQQQQQYQQYQQHQFISKTSGKSHDLMVSVSPCSDLNDDDYDVNEEHVLELGIKRKSSHTVGGGRRTTTHTFATASSTTPVRPTMTRTTQGHSLGGSSEQKRVGSRRRSLSGLKSHSLHTHRRSSGHLPAARRTSGSRRSAGSSSTPQRVQIQGVRLSDGRASRGSPDRRAQQLNPDASGRRGRPADAGSYTTLTTRSGGGALRQQVPVHHCGSSTAVAAPELSYSRKPSNAATLRRHVSKNERLGRTDSSANHLTRTQSSASPLVRIAPSGNPLQGAASALPPPQQPPARLVRTPSSTLQAATRHPHTLNTGPSDFGRTQSAFTPLVRSASAFTYYNRSDDFVGTQQRYCLPFARTMSTGSALLEGRAQPQQRQQVYLRPLSRTHSAGPTYRRVRTSTTAMMANARLARTQSTAAPFARTASATAGAGRSRTPNAGCRRPGGTPVTVAHVSGARALIRTASTGNSFNSRLTTPKQRRPVTSPSVNSMAALPCTNTTTTATRPRDATPKLTRTATAGRTFERVPTRPRRSGQLSDTVTPVAFSVQSGEQLVDAAPTLLHVSRRRKIATPVTTTRTAGSRIARPMLSTTRAAGAASPGGRPARPTHQGRRSTDTISSTGSPPPTPTPVVHRSSGQTGKRHATPSLGARSETPCESVFDRLTTPAAPTPKRTGGRRSTGSANSGGVSPLFTRQLSHQLSSIK